MKENLIFNLVFDPIYDKLNHLNRWQGVRIQGNETVSQHSFWVVVFSRILSEQIFKENAFETKLMISDYAFTHDMDEFITGDINHEVKYNGYNGEVIRGALDSYVRTFLLSKYDKQNKSENLLLKNMTGDVSPFVKKIVKVADWLSMITFLIGEKSSGNESINDKLLYCQNKIKEAAGDAIGSLLIYNEQLIDTEVLLLIMNKKWI